MIRRRLNRSQQITHSCLINPQTTECPHCQMVNDTFNTHSSLLRKVAYDILRNSELAEEFVYEFYSNKLTKKAHNFRANDPEFNARQYMVKMMRNFVLDELARRKRHAVIDKHIPGFTRRAQDLISEDFVSASVLYRNEIEFLFSVLSETEASLVQRMISPGWDLSQEAMDHGLQRSAIRARITRVRTKLWAKFTSRSVA